MELAAMIARRAARWSAYSIVISDTSPGEPVPKALREMDLELQQLGAFDLYGSPMNDSCLDLRTSLAFELAHWLRGAQCVGLGADFREDFKAALHTLEEGVVPGSPWSGRLGERRISSYPANPIRGLGVGSEVVIRGWRPVVPRGRQVDSPDTALTWA